MTVPSASTEPASRNFILLNLSSLNFKSYRRYAWVLFIPLIILMVLGAAWPLANTLLFSFTEASSENMNHFLGELFKYLDDSGDQLFAVK